MQIGSTHSLTGVVTIETSMQSVSGTDFLLMVVHQILVDDTRLVVGGTKLVDDTKPGGTNPGGVPILSQVLLLRRPMVDSGAEHTTAKTLKTLAHLACGASQCLSHQPPLPLTHTPPPAPAGQTFYKQCSWSHVCFGSYVLLVTWFL